MSTVQYSGILDVYFGRREDAPLVWCVASSDRKFEIRVSAFVLDGVVGVAMSDMKIMSRDQPCAWIRARGDLTVDVDGVALIRPTGEKK